MPQIAAAWNPLKLFLELRVAFELLQDAGTIGKLSVVVAVTGLS